MPRLIVIEGSRSGESYRLGGMSYISSRNGQLLITALFANDLPMVMTVSFIFAFLIVTFNLIADVLYGVLDPRIRYD